MHDKFRFPFYHKDADPEGVALALEFFNEFYSRYPTGAEVGEALHQYRREHDLIKAVEEKRRKIKQLEEEVDDQEHGHASALPAPDADTQGHKKPVRRRRNVANAGTGDNSPEQ